LQYWKSNKVTVSAPRVISPLVGTLLQTGVLEERKEIAATGSIYRGALLTDLAHPALSLKPAFCLLLLVPIEMRCQSAFPIPPFR
jgi:hypothetical protein